MRTRYLLCPGEVTVRCSWECRECEIQLLSRFRHVYVETGEVTDLTAFGVRGLSIYKPNRIQLLCLSSGL